MKRKLNLKNINRKRLIRIGCMLVVVYALVLIVDQEVRLKAVEAKRVEAQQQLEDETIKGEEYQRQLEYVNSPDYVEREARDKLGWVRKGEKIYMEKQ